MINLLPKETKDTIHAGRLNVLLRRYVVFTSMAVLLGIGAFATGYYLTGQRKAVLTQDALALEARAAEYTGVKQKAQELSNNLKITKQILSNEIVFSELSINIAKTLPPGAVLTNLNVSTQSIGKEVIINGRVRTPADGLALKNALEASPLFENVNIQNISRPAEETQSVDASPLVRSHPYVIILSTILTKPEKQGN